jgi:membrane protease YdiL (CAAX protease family)
MAGLFRRIKLRTFLKSNPGWPQVTSTFGGDFHGERSFLCTRRARQAIRADLGNRRVFFIANSILGLISVPLMSFVLMPAILAKHSISEASILGFAVTLTAGMLTIAAALVSVRSLPDLPGKLSALGLRSTPWLWYLVSALLAAIFALAFAAVDSADDSFASVLAKVQTRLWSPNRDLLLPAGAIVIAVLAREIVARGIVLQVLFRHLPDISALLLATAFALAQLPSRSFGWRTTAAEMLVIALSELTLCLIAAKSGSILPTMLASALVAVGVFLVSG